MDNMFVYDVVRTPPATALKPFNNGKFKGTDINPMWRIKTLTEVFGPCGMGWYYEVISERSESLADDTIIAVVDINLYVKYGDEWSKPIFGTGGNLLVSKTKNGIATSDEGYKMALTDALSVACRALGIGADVYFEKDRSSKYAGYYDAPPQAHQQPSRAGLITQEQVKQIKLLCAPDEISKLCAKYGVSQLADLSEVKAQIVINKLAERRNREAAQADQPPCADD